MAGQVQWAMLTACPSSLAAGKTVTPVIQAYEHGMENVCMCLCVCSQETVTVWSERGEGLYLLCQKQLNAWTLTQALSLLRVTKA